MQLTNLLNRRWPFSWPHSSDGALSIIIGGLNYFILAVLKPFGIGDAVSTHMELKLLGYWVISTFWVYLFQHVYPVYVSKFINVEEWTLGKTVFGAAFALLFIGLSVGLYTVLMFPSEPVAPSFVECVLYTFYLGVIPAGFIAAWNYIKYLQGEKALGVMDLSFDSNNQKKIYLVGDQQVEDFEILPSDIIVCCAQGNYVIVYYEANGKLEKRILRTTFKKISTNLPQTHFKLCHRSYIVNIHRIQSYSGTYKNFKLKMDLLKEEIPVSRSNVNTLKKWLEQHKKKQCGGHSQSSQSSKL